MPCEKCSFPTRLCQCQRLAVLKAVEEWDGCSAAELVLAVLVASGEDVRETLQEADYNWTRNLYPVQP